MSIAAYKKIGIVLNHIDECRTLEEKETIIISDIQFSKENPEFPISDLEIVLKWLEERGALKIIEIMEPFNYCSSRNYVIYVYQEFYSEYLDMFNGISQTEQNNSIVSDADCWYSSVTGRGNIKGKKFRLTEGKNTSLLFGALVKSKKITRARALRLLGLIDAKAPGCKAENTRKIKDTVAEIRKRTSLNKYEISSNSGNVTLSLEIKDHADPH
ncbi:MAG: hypothetical protein WC227_03885 [Patescibacteria group bacterium]|jgi:hypothetical protein